MPPPKKIKGRYEIKAVLGEGGMGVVYRAYDPPPMNREVAIKTLLEFPDRVSLQLFYKECEVLKSMSHPNIVEIFDMGEFDDGGQKKPFFVMPLLRGQTLDEIIRSSSHRLTVERVIEIATQTCRGLQTAHDHGLIHRDLKPSNLFVMEDDSVRIIDFGVVHNVDARTRSSGFQKGTLLYMAPEQITFKPVSQQSDIFSLGVVLYEALTRRQPFRGGSEEEIVNAILKHIPPPASEINPTVNPTVSRVIHKAMAKQPWNRFDTARELSETLQKALRNQPIELFDPARIQPRIQRAAKALETGDYQFASEIVTELEAEGNLDPQLTLLRTQVDQVVRQRTISQLLESARARFEEDEDPLALQKIQEVLQLDANNAAALGLKSKIEDRRSERQVDKWLRLARQHVDNHSYGPAREALQSVLQLKPSESRALRLLSDIDGEEREYLRLRQKKSQMYQGALNAWKNGEVSEALSQMGHVLELDREAPDTSSPETTAAYQNFYNQVRTEHDHINNGYAEARRALADGDYAKAIKTCDQFLAKYPHQALFQALKFDVEERQRQQLSAFIADVDRRLDAEKDLDAKVSLLQEALTTHPGEAHFQRSLRLLTDKRDLVNSILARAQLHEKHGQLTEAVNDMETLRTIYGQYPGLELEVERLQKRREQQARDVAKASCIEQVDRHLEAGNYSRALERLQQAKGEFSDDGEFVELEKLAREGTERAAQAEQLHILGRGLCKEGKFEEGLDSLNRAFQLDERNPGIRAALRDSLAERAQALLESDWQAAGAMAGQALELDSNHALARSVRARSLDQKRNAEVIECASQARRLQAAGDLRGATAKVENGLRAHPSEARLTVLRDTLNKEMSHLQRKEERQRDTDQARGLQHDAQEADTDRLKTIYARTQTYAKKYPEEAELQNIAREVERIVRAREGRAPSGKSSKKAGPPKNWRANQIVQSVVSASAKARTFLATRVMVWKAGISASAQVRRLLTTRAMVWPAAAICVLLIGLVAWRLRPYWTTPKKTATPVTLAFQIRTVPPGASLRIDGQVRGASNLELDLLPGDHQLEADLAGYQPAQTKLSVGAGLPSSFDVILQALPPAFRVATPDLENGQVWLDDNPAGSLENGSLTLSDLKDGKHVLRIAGPRSSGENATIRFETLPGSMSVSPTLEVHQLQVVVVSTGRGAAQVFSSLAHLPVAVDDKPSGQTGPDGVQITALNPGVHELTIGEGRDQRKMSFELGAVPAVDVIVSSDRDVGSALILTGQDDVDVYLDGQRSRRKTLHGQLRLPNLKTARHAIRIHKDGFKDPPEETVDIVKGQESKLTFVALVPLPKVASLSLNHMPPGTQVSFDEKALGIVGPEGTLSHENIAPGMHTLGFAVPGYQSKRLERKFSDGEVVHLGIADLDLKRAQGTFEIQAAANESVTIQQGDRIVHQSTGATRVSLDEGSYTITAHGANGRQTSTTLTLAAGETKSVNLKASSYGMERFDHAETWVEQGGWYKHQGGGVLLYDSPPGSGKFVFSLRLRFSHGPFSRKRFRWVVAYHDSGNYVEIEIDKQFLYRSEMVNGNKHEFPKVPHKIPENSPAVTFAVDVAPNILVHEYSLQGDKWQGLDNWDRTNAPSLEITRPFTDGRFGFIVAGDKDIEVSNFTFYPRR
jgi:eukaryotic-like serine/threonine-protein kinase